VQALPERLASYIDNLTDVNSEAGVGLMNNHNPCFWAGFTLIGE
jgi:hypothetical protein